MYTHPFNGPFSGTTRVSRYQKGITDLDFTEARDSEWQWHQLGHMQVCTSLQTDNHTSTQPLSFLQAGCPSCRPTNSVKALEALKGKMHATYLISMVSEVDRMRGFHSANLVPGEIAVELSEEQFGGAFFVVADAVDDPLRHDDAKFRECLFDV